MERQEVIDLARRTLDQAAARQPNPIIFLSRLRQVVEQARRDDQVLLAIAKDGLELLVEAMAA